MKQNKKEALLVDSCERYDVEKYANNKKFFQVKLEMLLSVFLSMN